MECIFCKIIKGEIPSKSIFENSDAIVFEDINPQAPVHLLAVPKIHFSGVDEIDDKNSSSLPGLFKAVREAAKINNLSDDGYRLIINSGKAAGQLVFHMHIHILGGKKDLGPML